MFAFNTEICDYYDHPNNVPLEYILENTLYTPTQTKDKDDEFHSLKNQFNSVLLNSCSCPVDCTARSGCSHSANYELHTGEHSKEPELVLKESGGRRDLIYECSSLCEFERTKCMNRLVQFGPRKSLRIVHSVIYKSMGVITLENIPRGGFICEYAGEIITLKEARLRTIDNEKHKRMNYILYLKESKIDDVDGNTFAYTIIDPSRKGNIGRYLNHSCSPNCQINSVRVDCPIPKIAIFANRNILSGEELCFHYNGGVSAYTRKSLPVAEDAFGPRIPCLCGAKNCEMHLPNTEFLNCESNPEND